MAELNNTLLEQLIDCQEGDMPSALTVRLMASEIMRIRGYGNMIPAPDEAARHRSMLLLKLITSDKSVGVALKRISEAVMHSSKIDMYSTIIESLKYIIGDEMMLNGEEWVEIPTGLLEEADLVIHDAVGFGTSHNHRIHNDTLNTLRKFFANAQGSQRTLVPKKLIEQMKGAVDEIVYGKQYSMATRENLIQRLGELLDGPQSTGPGSEE